MLGQCQFKLYDLGLDAAAPAVTGIQQEAIEEEEDDGEDNSSVEC